MRTNYCPKNIQQNKNFAVFLSFRPHVLDSIYTEWNVLQNFDRWKGVCSHGTFPLEVQMNLGKVFGLQNDKLLQLRYILNGAGTYARNAEDL